jgi:CheY-like chemotaxis protein
VTLAYRDDAASRTGAARAASGQKAASSPAILIAEDNAISRDLAVMTATRRGYRVTSARDGVEALEKMAGGAFDLVLMDLRMPRMDGFQATREIKRRWPDQRIIAVSATEVSVADKPEFDGFLAKPINWNAVAAYLDPALG